MSSSNPNLQNIPVRREEGREIRRAFVPGEGFDQLLVADYSQIELRIMAHLSQDEGLLDAFASEEDVHATTAAKVFDLPLEAVDGPLRDRAKAVNYGLAYGLTPFGLGQQLGIPPDEAAEIVDRLLRAVPEGALASSTQPSIGRHQRRVHHDDVRAAALPAGPAVGQPQPAADGRTHGAQRPDPGHGRRRHQARDDRPVSARSTRSGLRTQLLLQVHDEVVLEVPEDEREAAREPGRRETLASVCELAVPLEVDTAFGIDLVRRPEALRGPRGRIDHRAAG